MHSVHVKEAAEGTWATGAPYALLRVVGNSVMSARPAGDGGLGGGTIYSVQDCKSMIRVIAIFPPPVLVFILQGLTSMPTF